VLAFGVAAAVVSGTLGVNSTFAVLDGVQLPAESSSGSGSGLDDNDLVDEDSCFDESDLASCVLDVSDWQSLGATPGFSGAARQGMAICFSILATGVAHITLSARQLCCVFVPQDYWFEAILNLCVGNPQQKRTCLPRNPLATPFYTGRRVAGANIRTQNLPICPLETFFFGCVVHLLGGLVWVWWCLPLCGALVYVQT
jgi:hypothetical protein